MNKIVVIDTGIDLNNKLMTFKQINGVELFMVKLFDSNALDVDEDLLCFALEYILYHVKCDIINMSLGTCLMESERLYQICRQLYERKK